MNPRLAAIAGPFEGTTFPLTEEEFSIGRALSNRLPITDPDVSRSHCLIRREAGHFTIRDLESHNCTFVNDLPIKEQVLVEGDRVRVGRSLFVFLVGEEVPATSTSGVRLEWGELEAASTSTLRMDETPYLRPESIEDELPALGLMARDLAALFKISAVINFTSSPEELQGKLLELIFEVVPAESGAILLGDNPDRFSSIAGWDRRSGSDRPVSISHSVVRRTVRERIVVLANGIQRANNDRSASLIDARIESVLCVPLLLFEKVLGAVYLQTTDAKARFGDDHVHLMSAIAPIAAVALRNVMRLASLESENLLLRADSERRHEMVGGSPRLRQVQQLIDRVAPTDSTVLITGESGTGKELVARAIHRSSPRAARPFVAINCAALTETLLESELFGHERGAFTGAFAQKKGKLEMGEGGTVFLDEMGDLAPQLQGKILRVLQEHEFERVGGTRPIKIDIRLIAATNKDLEEAVRSGTFRTDLYYRLNVISVKMPALRERREDIPLLAAYFAAKSGERSKRRVLGISDEARACLLAYDWPGNVRELENAIERAVVLGSGEFIEPEDLPEPVVEAKPPEAASTLHYYEAVKESKRQLILKALRQSRGSYVEAARLLGMHVNYLHRLISNLDLRQAVRGEPHAG